MQMKKHLHQIAKHAWHLLKALHKQNAASKKTQHEAENTTHRF